MSEMIMRYRMGERDAWYGGRVVNGAKAVSMMSDCASRLMAKEYGNIGRCIAVPKTRLFLAVYPGDFTEYHARILGEEDGKVTIETRCFKIATVPENPPFESSVDILEKPGLIAASIMIFELPK